MCICLCVWHLCGAQGGGTNPMCKVARTNDDGVCKKLSRCPKVVDEIVKNGLQPNICSEGRQIVCCPNE